MLCLRSNICVLLRSSRWDYNMAVFLDFYCLGYTLIQLHTRVHRTIRRFIDRRIYIGRILVRARIFLPHLFSQDLASTQRPTILASWWELNLLYAIRFSRALAWMIKCKLIQRCSISISTLRLLLQSFITSFSLNLRLTLSPKLWILTVNPSHILSLIQALLLHNLNFPRLFARARQLRG